MPAILRKTFLTDGTEISSVLGSKINETCVFAPPTSGGDESAIVGLAGDHDVIVRTLIFAREGDVRIDREEEMNHPFI